MALLIVNDHEDNNGGSPTSWGRGWPTLRVFTASSAMSTRNITICDVFCLKEILRKQKYRFRCDMNTI